MRVKYEEIPSSTNQEVKLTITPFIGDFIEGKDYFMILMKEKVNQQGVWIPIIKTEKLRFSEVLSHWKTIVVPLNCLIPKAGNYPNEREVPIRLCINQYCSNGMHVF